MKLESDFNKGSRRRRGTQAAAVALAAALVAASCIPVAADVKIGDGVTASCDEAYYATLDYYGNLTEGSVVKSYALNGSRTVVDYGNYDQIVNLTDDIQPSTAGGKTVFQFNDQDAPDHFYFEGKTTEPFKNLPWTVSVSYKLNGVPTKAEDLAGKSGMVEMNLDIMPNKNASDYAKNNYILTATTVFNQDDILSLKAEGAQVQMIGNLRLVMFMALPGEEEHFTLDVGANDFESDGITFLMVPATLSQLDQIAELSDRKDELKDDYDKLNESLDTLLDSVQDMSGSLYATADGLDELDQARGTISAGKGEVYAGADKALGDLTQLNDSLSKLPGHLDTASQAVTDVTDDLTRVTKTAVGLKSELEDVQDSLNDLQADLDDVHDALTSGSGSLQDHLETLGTDADALKTSIAALRTTLQNLDIQLQGEDLTINGMTPDEINTALSTAESLDGIYQEFGGSSLDEQEFLAAALILDAAQKGTSLTPAQAAAELETQETALTDAVVAEMTANPGMSQADALQAVLESDSDAAAAYQQSQLLKSIYASVTGGDDQPMDETQFFTAVLMLNAIQSGDKASGVMENESTYQAQAEQLMQLITLSQSGMVDGLLKDMSDLCGDLGSDGISGDLSDLTGLSGDTLDDLDTLTDTADDILSQTETLLDNVKTLDNTINSYVPELKTTLRDTKEIVGTMSSTIGDTQGFLSSFEALLKKSGTQLDAGTKKTLESLADALRQTAKSTSKTKDVISAKDNIDSIIRNTWDEHTGDTDNLLNMDSKAAAVSLTSASNPAPQSIQVLLRTQEIKVQTKENSQQAETKSDKGTFWSRVGQMFKDFWHSITGVFH